MTASIPAQAQRAGLDASPATQTRIWDLPTRVFHWALAVAVIAQIATGFGGAMEWHFRIGYALLALLLFRIAWGFVGGRWSRFSSFLYSPRSLRDYLRGRAPPDHLVGHSPLGALSVFALLLLLAVQVATGLVSDDEIAASGPLAQFVPGAIVSAATYWHAMIGKWIVIGLASLHVLAVLFYVGVRRQRLVRPMITGDKRLPDGGTAPSRDDAASRLLAMAVFAACAAFATWIASLRP
ncbi:cytochrome b/b6 domain-containing protein [Variovorax sp. J31P179]|uniref:cytochrome b/b6 domain-containing protein n=1 Tax=Variovorax sp. J31P179 TaxID=3053508 RepID=UPI002578EECF|nr:cytochrome b/b6 domain-containing protein [Variovorax sp. J31P179]MDM0082702.1 cytochrome b/b6 domain-containing protein [Variovorax sp. J31P179]